MQCKQCGKCCANILLLTNKEIEKIKEHIRVHHIKSNNHQNILSQEMVNICPFLQDNKKCSIYKIRPQICRDFACYSNERQGLDYQHIKPVNMTQTFFPQEYCPNIDLTVLTNRVTELQQTFKSGGSNRERRI